MTTTLTWTRVDDQLPDDDQTVLIACSDGDVVSGGRIALEEVWR